MLTDLCRYCILPHPECFTPTYSSVRNGDAGNPSLLNKLAPCGLSAHAYRTNFGSVILSLHTTTVFPSMVALAHTNFLSAPAMANWLRGSPSFVTNPDPML